MQVLAVFGVALAPSLLWLWYFWSGEENREAAGPLARTFLWGAAYTIPALILEVWLMGAGGVGDPKTAITIPIATILFIGPIEELCKYLATRRAIESDPAFDEASDGVIYAAASALGFAFAENLGYLASLEPGTIVARSLMSVPGHVLFASWWGAAMGRVRFVPGTSPWELWRGLICGSFMHGLYDTFVLEVHLYPEAIFCLIFTVWLMWKQYRRLMADVLRHSKPPAPPAPVTLVDELPFVPAEPASPPVLVPAASPAGTELRFQWVGISVLLGVISTTGSLFMLGVVMAVKNPELAKSHALQPSGGILLAATILGLMLGGMTSAYLSPGRTVRETSLGLAILGGFVGLGGGLISSAIFSVPFALMGALGGWLGEAVASDRGHGTRGDLTAAPTPAGSSTSCP